MHVPVPLPRGITSAEDFPKAREYLTNLINIGGNQIVPRPGVEAYVPTTGFCRGSVFYRKRLFHASAETLTLLPDNNESASVAIGNIPGVDRVFFSPGHTMMMILARGGNLLKWENTGGPGTVTDVTDTPNFRRSVDVAFIDGRWCYCPADGGPIIYSEVGDGANIFPGNLFDAELVPDDNLGLLNARNTLYVLGEETIEPFRSSGNEDAPFLRVQGGQIAAGYISARIVYGPSFAFIGRNEKGLPGIFVAGQGEAIPISNDPVDEILNSYTRDQLYTAISQRFTWRKLDTLVFSLPGHTLAFAGGEWFEFTSLDDRGLRSTWNVVHTQYAYGKYICGDRTRGRSGELKAVSSEYGRAVQYELLTYVRDKPDRQLVVRGAEVDTRMGLVPTPEGPQFVDRLEQHVGSQWQIATDPGFTNIVYDSGTVSSTPKTQLQVTAPLEGGTQYFWRVRYLAEVTRWSAYSEPFTFTTLNDVVDTPYITSPTFGEVDVAPAVTLTASPFLAVGLVQTHTASQWQVATDPGFSDIVFDSGVDASNLESITVDPPLELSGQYYARVRYEGSVNGFSAYSPFVVFNTLTAGVSQPVNISPIDGQFNVPRISTVLVSSEFTDASESHEASQWQIATDLFFTDVVFDSGETADDLTRIVSDVTLGFAQTYYWRVRHKGTLTGYSPYSIPTKFTSESIPDFARVTSAGDVRVIVGGQVRVVRETS